jgi:hypothetical protein
MGDIAGARERRRLATQLQQLRHEMVLLAEAERNGAIPHWKALPSGYEAEMSPSPPSDDPFAHLKERAQERAQRTVERTRGAILTLQAREEKVTADSLRQASRELEPGFAGVSFQVIRRNPAAYALYREAAYAFVVPARDKTASRRKRRRTGTRAGGRMPRATYDPLESRSKKELVRRVRSLERELETERQRLASLAYDKQALLAQFLRTETDNVLLRAEQAQSGR